MNLLIALVALSGLATYYSPGLMETVAANRGMPLDGYAGGVALNDCEHLGRSVWLEWEDGDIEGPFLVVDCAQQRHVGARDARGYVAEVDASVAKEHGFYGVGPVPCSVWFEQPPAGMPRAY